MTEPNGKLAQIIADAAVEADRRMHQRVTVPLKVKYLLPDQSEHPARVLNISVNGALLRAHPGASVDDKVVLYIEKLGRFEAVVTRIEDAGFAVHFNSKRKRQKRTADALIWLMNGAEKSMNKRRAKRIKQDKPAVAILPDGTEQNCRILDISITGASVAIDPRPPVDDIIMMGRTKARIVRHHEEGVGVEFLNTNTEDQVN
jgi:hypothetical protein